nr:MAG TPA: Protein of unknown function (DUF3624) [Caudoviricetes sp.]
MYTLTNGRCWQCICQLLVSGLPLFPRASSSSQ